MGSQSDQKILLVDDEEVILDLLRYNLENEGYTVEAVDNGKTAVEVAKTFLPDAILLDIMMPEQDGVETCRQLRALPELSGTFILFLTARSEEYSEVAAFDVGADDYITKPIKPRALLSRISALFRRDIRKTDQAKRIVIGMLE
ncbi:MAG: response regulator, partial [Cyclobacteriaceae bacterium]|nr:response regulator [Cyclobacteriaceae bacterium]